ncbi:hypothetical protein PR202_ga02373 [Eleusine coracana subsp. coracana]|uniref:Protein kinase domain-containing protein n=1 Tax=Eleusine coracana subsp. coracana TaxID=191504 RepID=A0AAV5BKP8_ELECO|nr:hypothetical protein PR202_ga02373 [Eleusine coracana subsp. coracana]
MPQISARLMTNPAYFEVGRFLGGYGFMNITSYSSSQFGQPSNADAIEELDLGYSAEEIDRLRVQDVGEGEVKIRLYEGRVVQGPFRGTKAIFKTEIALQQWLAFRDDGRYSAADYAKVASERQSKQLSGDLPFWNPFSREYKLELRRYFVLRLLNGALCGLVHMHNHDRLHQSLGPSSVVLNYGAGLLVAYMAFVPFCEAGVIDGISLQIVGTCLFTFSNLGRYCLEDDRLADAINFLDLGDGAGWELLQAMLHPDYRKRPIAEAVLNHRFISGAVLRNY